jgi:pimeloyl-ACP methyl ester carboxylesterase
LDSRCWFYQFAHLTPWFRCIGVDLPGYGRSPAVEGGFRLPDIAAACWDAVERVSGGKPVILVGCSAGSAVALYTYHARPSAVRAMVLSGTGLPRGSNLGRRIAGYREQGLAYRREFVGAVLSPAFSQSPLGRWLAQVFDEGSPFADLDTIIRLLDALQQPDPDWVQAEIRVPVLILSGSEDGAHRSAFVLRDRLPDGELVTIEGAGHACFLEQPWAFNRELLTFMDRRKLIRTA